LSHLILYLNALKSTLYVLHEHLGFVSELLEPDNLQNHIPTLLSVLSVLHKLT